MRPNSKFLQLAGAALCALGCGTGTQAPLDIYPDVSREQAISALRARDYCRGDIPVRSTETYPQCRHPGARFAHSWVVVEYRLGVLARLQRCERHRDPARAATRWNELVSARSHRLGSPSPAAREKLHSRPAGRHRFLGRPVCRRLAGACRRLSAPWPTVRRPRYLGGGASSAEPPSPRQPPMSTRRNELPCPK